MQPDLQEYYSLLKHKKTFSDKQEAADLMAKIRGNIDKLINHYKADPASMSDPRVQVMIDRFNPQNMVENDLNDGSTSYSENKGEKIVVCYVKKHQDIRS